MAMATIHDIPPEILAASFEVGIYTWGIGYLRQLSLVCQAWRDTIEHTPRLWGIVSFTRSSSAAALRRQLGKAKHAPLALVLEPQTITRSDSKARVRKVKEEVLKTLLGTVGGWVSADVGTDMLALCRWGEMVNLERLVLRRCGTRHQDPGAFFGGEDTDEQIRNLKLHSFSATAGVPKSWVIPFLKLCPSIRHFSLDRGHNAQTSTTYNSNLHDIRDTWTYLSLIPNAHSIELAELSHTSPTRVSPPAHTLFVHLRTLRLRNVLYAPAVLRPLVVPNLQTLSLEHVEMEYTPWSMAPDEDNDFQHGLLLAPVFAQWSAPGSVPEHLHTLELKECLRAGDVPYLVRWLERLPRLVRLVIQDDDVGKAARKGDGADPDTNIYQALSAPRKMASQKDTDGSATVGWLCPNLMILYLDTDHDLADVVSIARARGGKAFEPLGSEPPPARLHRIETRLCPTAEHKDVLLLRSLIDRISCVCTNCGLMLESPSRG